MILTQHAIQQAKRRSTVTAAKIPLRPLDDNVTSELDDVVDVVDVVDVGDGLDELA
jgi:hypothetical protein